VISEPTLGGLDRAGAAHRSGSVALAMSCVGVLLFLLLLAAATLTLRSEASRSGMSVSSDVTEADGVSELAMREIPASYLNLYLGAAARYGLDWSVLAGIGKVECNHGLDPAPACTVKGVENSAGAGGPMQFLASTWARYGVDGDGDGRVDRWDPADAIYGAARYLRSLGAPQDYSKAIFGYNHASWYVEEVEHWAALYRAPAAGASDAEGIRAGVPTDSGTSTPVRYIPGDEALLSPQDGHVALVPEAVPVQVKAMVIAGNELEDLPYGTSGHPDPLGATSEDCSSTVNYVLYRAGIRPLAEIVSQNPLAQDYVNWGLPGKGRWVTIYATDSPTPHVFIVIADLRLDTSHDGTDVGPNRKEGGPRWRIFGHIPTWAHWSVRHPPGL
jgi:Transglycosylase SLT domain